MKKFALSILLPTFMFCLPGLSLSFFPVFFLSISTYANTPQSSISLATGGGGVASVEAGEASFMNPATLTHLKGRNFFSTAQKKMYALSLTQNDKQSAVPGAFSYFADKELQMFSLSLSDFIFENVAFGISATYWQAQFLPVKKRDTAFNGNAGLVWTPLSNLGIGFAAENMFRPTDEFKQEGRLIPTSRFGLNYLYQEWFRWRLDFVTLTNNRWDNWTPQTGIESYLSKWFIVRLGYTRPPGLKESWSTGIGFDLPRFNLDFASRNNVGAKKEELHSVDLTIPF